MCGRRNFNGSRTFQFRWFLLIAGKAEREVDSLAAWAAALFNAVHPIALRVPSHD
jgi:hypothetical protein